MHYSVQVFTGKILLTCLLFCGTRVLSASHSVTFTQNLPLVAADSIIFQDAPGMSADQVFFISARTDTARMIPVTETIPDSLMEAGAATRFAVTQDSSSGFSTDSSQVVLTMRSELDSLLGVAMLQLNKPYKYASKGPDRFDCSGFTGYVFQYIGIQLPASSRQQASVGSHVDKADLQPGDLVFFNSPASGIHGIGHVGMVTRVSEEGIEFIHCSSKRGVVISNLISKHYTDHYMGARRVL